MNVRFAQNKTKLSACLGISRTLLYEYLRLPDAPAPCTDGRWSVPVMRKFIASHAKKIKAPNEVEALKIRKLTLQCEREEHELDVAREKVRDEITREVAARFMKFLSILNIRLDRLPGECAAILTRMSPGEIRRELKRRLDEARIECVNEFRPYKQPDKADKPKENVIQFERVATR